MNHVNDKTRLNREIVLGNVEKGDTIIYYDNPNEKNKPSFLVVTEIDENEDLYYGQIYEPVNSNYQGIPRELLLRKNFRIIR